jgi:hypothetical protein
MHEPGAAILPHATNSSVESVHGVCETRSVTEALLLPGLAILVPLRREKHWQEPLVFQEVGSELAGPQGGNRNVLTSPRRPEVDSKQACNSGELTRELGETCFEFFFGDGCKNSFYPVDLIALQGPCERSRSKKRR